MLADADADRGTDIVHQVGTLFFGPDGAPTLREMDETFGPITKREEVVHASSGCRLHRRAAEKLLLCHDARVIPKFRRRAARPLRARVLPARGARAL